MAQLNISNVINISVSQPGAGLGYYNTSNIAIFTDDTAGSGFGSAGYKIYLSPDEVSTDFGSSSDTYKMALAVFSQKPNILAGGGYLVVITLNSAETLDHAVTRTKDLVQYFGVMCTNIQSSADMLATGAVIQTLNKMAFFVTNVSADIASVLGLLKSNNYTQSRALFYGSATAVDALVMMASYASRALSVDFNGSNTTATMHLKDLVGVSADPSMTQTILNTCNTNGVDVYASIQGVSKTLTSGANGFFDDIYNLQWLTGALQVAGFNALAQTGTKIPQTENGMNILKGAYRKVLEQSVSNQYCAPGEWNSPVTFGNQADLVANIAQRGYYIYSSPVASQLPSVRASRQAPLIQIALKVAGAIHSSTVIVTVNA
jgi:hypothetical protein